MSDFTFSFHFHALEKDMAAHSSVLAWRIPGMGEPGGLLSMGSQSRTRLKRLSSSSSSEKTSSAEAGLLLQQSQESWVCAPGLEPRSSFLSLQWHETHSRNTGRGLHVLIPLGFLAPSLMSAAARPAQSPLCLVACLLTVLRHLRFREGEIDKGQKRWERKRRETILNGKGTKSKPATGSVFILFQLRKETVHSLKKYFFHVPWPSIAIPVKHY